jgi:hypothetical protein
VNIWPKMTSAVVAARPVPNPVPASAISALAVKTMASSLPIICSIPIFPLATGVYHRNLPRPPSHGTVVTLNVSRNVPYRPPPKKNGQQQ